MKMMTTYISQFGLLNLYCYSKENVKYYQRVNKISFNHPTHTQWLPALASITITKQANLAPGVPPSLTEESHSHHQNSVFEAKPINTWHVLKPTQAIGQLETSTQLKLSSAMSPQEEFLSSPKCLPLHWLELSGQLLTIQCRSCPEDSLLTLNKKMCTAPAGLLLHALIRDRTFWTLGRESTVTLAPGTSNCFQIDYLGENITGYFLKSSQNSPTGGKNGHRKQFKSPNNQSAIFGGLP